MSESSDDRCHANQDDSEGVDCNEDSSDERCYANPDNIEKIIIKEEPNLLLANESDGNYLGDENSTLNYGGHGDSAIDPLVHDYPGIRGEEGTSCLPVSRKYNSVGQPDEEGPPPVLNGRRKKTSNLWKYFCDDDGIMATCRVCEIRLSYKSTTTNLMRHLSKKHPLLHFNALYGEKERPPVRRKYNVRKKKRTSIVWQYVTQVDQSTAKCKLCRQEIRHLFTSNLVRHFRAKHPGLQLQGNLNDAYFTGSATIPDARLKETDGWKGWPSLEGCVNLIDGDREALNLLKVLETLPVNPSPERLKEMLNEPPVINRYASGPQKEFKVPPVIPSVRPFDQNDTSKYFDGPPGWMENLPDRRLPETLNHPPMCDSTVQFKVPLPPSLSQPDRPKKTNCSEATTDTPESESPVQNATVRFVIPQLVCQLVLNETKTPGAPPSSAPLVQDQEKKPGNAVPKKHLYPTVVPVKRIDPRTMGRDRLSVADRDRKKTCNDTPKIDPLVQDEQKISDHPPIYKLTLEEHEDPCTPEPSTEDQKSQLNVDLSTSQATNCDRLLNRPMKKLFRKERKKLRAGTKKKYDHLLLKIFIDDLERPTLIENESFARFVKTMCPGYTMPDKRTLTDVMLPEMYDRCMSSVRGLMESAPAISLSIDLWRAIDDSTAGLVELTSYVSVTAHLIDDDFRLHSVFLGCSVLKTPYYKSGNIASKVRRVANRYNIADEMITSVVTDGKARDMREAVVHRLKWRYYECFCNALNRVITNSLGEVRVLLDKVEALVALFDSDVCAASVLMESQRQAAVVEFLREERAGLNEGPTKIGKRDDKQAGSAKKRKNYDDSPKYILSDEPPSKLKRRDLIRSVPSDSKSKNVEDLSSTSSQAANVSLKTPPRTFNDTAKTQRKCDDLPKMPRSHTDPSQKLFGNSPKTIIKRSFLKRTKLSDAKGCDGGSPKKLLQHDKTRWTTTLDMLERLCELKDAVKIAVTSFYRRIKTDVKILTEVEWVVCEQLVKVLKPFNEIVGDMTTGEYLYGSMVSVLTNDLKSLCQRLVNDSRLHIIVQCVVSALRDGFSAKMFYYDDFEVDVLGLCTFLDPRLKLLPYHDEPSISDRIRRKVIDLVVRDIIGERAATSSLDSAKESKIDEDAVGTEVDVLTEATYGYLWEDFDDFVSPMNPKGSAAASTAVIEVERYLHCECLRREKDPLAWWKQNQDQFPNLARLTKTRFSVLGSSAPCAHIYSPAGQAFDEKRMRLSPAHVEKLLFLNKNAYLIGPE